MGWGFTQSSITAGTHGSGETHKSDSPLLKKIKLFGVLGAIAAVAGAGMYYGHRTDGGNPRATPGSSPAATATKTPKSSGETTAASTHSAKPRVTATAGKVTVTLAQLDQFAVAYSGHRNPAALVYAGERLTGQRAADAERRIAAAALAHHTADALAAVCAPWTGVADTNTTLSPQIAEFIHGLAKGGDPIRLPNGKMDASTAYTNAVNSCAQVVEDYATSPDGSKTTVVIPTGVQG